MPARNRTKHALLVEALQAEPQPEGPVATALVQTMAVARWRLTRIWSIEKAGFDRKIAERTQSGQSDPATLAVDVLPRLEVTSRYETRYDRQFTRALNALRAVRALRASAAPKP